MNIKIINFFFSFIENDDCKVNKMFGIYLHDDRWYLFPLRWIVHSFSPVKWMENYESGMVWSFLNDKNASLYSHSERQ